MHGLPLWILPVFICNMAEPWIGESAVIDLMKAMSSTQVARCGKRSETSCPDWPYFLNAQRGSTMRPWSLWPPRPNVLTSMVLLSMPFMAGLWSKVSMWLGPPYM